MFADPIGKRLFGKLSRSDRQDRIASIGLVRDEPPGILAQEDAKRGKGCSLIAIYKRVIAGDPKDIGSAQTGRVADVFLGESVFGFGKSGFECSFVSDALKSAMFGERLSMQEEHSCLGDPARLFHLARVRNISRYSPMNSRPILSSSSISGS